MLKAKRPYFLKEVKLHAIFFSMLIVKPPIIENSDYTLFYSGNLRFTIDFRKRYQLQWCDGAFCQKHFFICTDFAVIVFGGYYGQFEDCAVNSAVVHSKIVI